MNVSRCLLAIRELFKYYIVHLKPESDSIIKRCVSVYFLTSAPSTIWHLRLWCKACASWVGHIHTDVGKPRRYDSSFNFGCSHFKDAMANIQQQGQPQDGLRSPVALANMQYGAPPPVFVPQVPRITEVLGMLCGIYRGPSASKNANFSP